MKTKTLFALSVLSVISLVSLTGCGSKSGGNEYAKYAKYVTLGDYKNLEIDRVVYTITDEDVQSEIEGLLYSYAETNEISDRAAQDGDIVNIDYVGTVDGEEFEDGSEEDCEVEIGSETFIEGFEEQLVGMKNGETKDITVTFPEPYDGVLDGKEAIFHVTMNQIYELDMPKYNDEFVQEYTDSSTTDEYEAALKEELQTSSDEDSESMACSDALYEIMENSTFDGYPQELYDLTKTELETSIQDMADMFGMEVSELFGDDYDIDEATAEAVNEKLIVYAIADAEKLQVSDEDYDSYVAENYELYGYESKEEYEEDYSPESTKYDILYNKVMDFLSENVTFNDILEEDFEMDEDLEWDIEDGDEDEGEDLTPEEVEALENAAAAEAETSTEEAQ